MSPTEDLNELENRILYELYSDGGESSVYNIARRVQETEPLVRRVLQNLIDRELVIPVQTITKVKIAL